MENATWSSCIVQSKLRKKSPQKDDAKIFCVSDAHTLNHGADTSTKLSLSASKTQRNTIVSASSGLWNATKATTSNSANHVVSDRIHKFAALTSAAVCRVALINVLLGTHLSIMCNNARDSNCQLNMTWRKNKQTYSANDIDFYIFSNLLILVYGFFSGPYTVLILISINIWTKIDCECFWEIKLRLSWIILFVLVFITMLVQPSNKTERTT